MKTAAELLVERTLVASETAIPGLSLALDAALLREWAAEAGLELDHRARVDRLRYKPSTALRAAVDPGDGGGWWLLTVHSPDSWRKAGKDVRAGARVGRVLVDEGRRAVLVPAAGDRALPQLRRKLHGPAAWTVAHNPARRAVLRVGGDLVKVHADDETSRRSARAGAAVTATGVRTPSVTAITDHTATSTWVTGTVLGADRRDVEDVAELVARLSSGQTDGLPELHPAEIDAGVLRAVTSLLTVPLPAQLRTRVAQLGRRWRAWSADPVIGVGAAGSPLRPRELAHGDLSPDQLLRCAGTGELVVLDLDRAARAPRGWDAASWLAANAALGRGAVALQGQTPHPLLVAAAAAVRCVEPFRRRRLGWLGQTLDLVALSERCFDALDTQEAGT